MTGTGVTQLPDTQVNFLPISKGQIRIYPCPADPKMNSCSVESFFDKNQDPDQLVLS